MSLSPKSKRKTAAQAERALGERSYPALRLYQLMACDTAFRVVARRCLEDLTACCAATRRGDGSALHQMRIALTRLRTAMAFFSPMIADTEGKRLKRELKWLNGELGGARDLDVAIAQLRAVGKGRHRPIPETRSWSASRTDSYRKLSQMLESARYRRLIKSTATWIENGPWSTQDGKRAASARATPISTYCVRKLTRWQERLLKKSRGLHDMGKKERHRLRLQSKKLRYSMEFFQELFPTLRAPKKNSSLKHLRVAQAALGELNDGIRTQSLAASRERNGMQTKRFLTREREKRLVRKAATAYRKIAKIKPLRI